MYTYVDTPPLMAGLTAVTCSAVKTLGGLAASGTAAFPDAAGVGVCALLAFQALGGAFADFSAAAALAVSKPGPYILGSWHEFVLRFFSHFWTVEMLGALKRDGFLEKMIRNVRNLVLDWWSTVMAQILVAKFEYEKRFTLW